VASVTRPAPRDPGHREAVARQVAAAVERLLADGEGFTALAIQRIAAEAGIARSTFYLHFPDKTALLMRITEAASGDLFAAAEGWLADGFADRSELERTLLGVVGQQREHSALLRALAEVAGYDEQVASFWRDRVGGFIAQLSERIEEGQRAGTIAPELDPESTAAWITWGVERLAAQHVASEPPERDPQLAAGLATAIWSTLGR